MKISAMKKWAATGLTLWLLGSAPSGFAQKVTDYTADQVTLSADGKMERQSKVYFSGNNMRIDDPMPQSGVKLVVIFRGDLKKNFMLNIDKKSYTERELDEKEMPGNLMAMGVIKNRKEKKLGEETVNGYLCAKKETEIEVEVMGFRNTSRSIVWQSPKFDLPLRTRGDAGDVTELRNIREEKPAAVLFEVPADFKKVADMMELMGDEGLQRGRPPKSSSKSREAGAIPPGTLPPGMKLPVPKQ